MKLKTIFGIVFLVIALVGMAYGLVDSFLNPQLTQKQLFIKNWKLVFVVLVSGIMGVLFTHNT